jgi:NADH:ubiquinone oxidoreductase subunit 6 (subunit J)
MKDIVISGRQIIREVLIYVGCILAALLVNVYSILHFNTQWKELVTTLNITLALALVFFAVVAVLRVTVFCCRRLLQKKAG